MKDRDQQTYKDFKNGLREGTGNSKNQEKVSKMSLGKISRNTLEKIATNKLARTLSINQEKVSNMSLGRYTVRFGEN